jgi:hypothetical protein
VAHETVKVNQSTHIYIEDSRIGGADDNAIDFVAVQDGHIVGNRVFGAGDWCGYVKGGSASILVDSNEFHDCGTGGFTAGQGTGLQFMSTPWLHYEAYDIRVVNNIVHDTEGAGLGVSGGYNVLVAWNTLYRVGTRSHVLEAGFGARSCDAADVASELTACESRLAAGAWGTTVVDDGDNFVRIPNNHVFLLNNVVFNPEGAGSQWQHFQIAGAAPGGATGPGVPVSSRGDNDVRIAGNVIWNGPSGHPLGVGGDAGCPASHATCSDPALSTSGPTTCGRPARWQTSAVCRHLTSRMGTCRRGPRRQPAPRRTGSRSIATAARVAPTTPLARRCPSSRQGPPHRRGPRSKRDSRSHERPHASDRPPGADRVMRKRGLEPEGRAAQRRRLRA